MPDPHPASSPEDTDEEPPRGFMLEVYTVTADGRRITREPEHFVEGVRVLPWVGGGWPPCQCARCAAGVPLARQPGTDR